MSTFDPFGGDRLLSIVAHAIAREIARKHIEADAALAKLDGLGKATAVHTMALRMAAEVKEEAAAAIKAVRGEIADAHALVLHEAEREFLSLGLFDLDAGK